MNLKTEMKWSRDLVLTWGYIRNLMLIANFDRSNVISSGSTNEGWMQK
jgi:hypothetical protein